jgi:hypothetical protein
VAPPAPKSQAVLGRKVWGDPWEYRLAIRDSSTKRLVADNLLVEGARLTLALARDQAVQSASKDRWIYVYVIDANGAIQLAFPRVGSLGNQIPAGQSAEGPMKPAVDFVVSAPFGADRYVTIATLRPIDEPSALNSTRSAWCRTRCSPSLMRCGREPTPWFHQE